MKKFLWAFLVIIILIITIIAYFVLTSSPRKMSEAEKNSRIGEILGRKPNLTDTSPKGNALYKGKYASFSYPALAKIYTYRDAALKNDTSILDSFSFDISNPRLVLNFAVIERSNLTSVGDIPDVRFRQLSENGYAQSEATADGNKGLLFEKNQEQSEISAFFLVGKIEYSISITGNNFKEVEKLFNQVVSSFKLNP